MTCLFSNKTSHICRHVILPHSGFNYYHAFTPYGNLRYKTIQEHVASLLSNNYCSDVVSDLYLTLPECLDTKTSFKPQ